MHRIYILFSTVFFLRFVLFLFNQSVVSHCVFVYLLKFFVVSISSVSFFEIRRLHVLYADEKDKIKKTLSPIFEANKTDTEREQRTNIDTGYSMPSPISRSVCLMHLMHQTDQWAGMTDLLANDQHHTYCTAFKICLHVVLSPLRLLKT